VLPSSAQRILSGLEDSALVLDIGGWADPFARADWVLDFMPYDTRGLYEREGWIEPRAGEAERFDRSRWVQRDICDREPYPFTDGQFDFAICSQTLEDVRDPVWVCAEMIRIAQAGYIEVPSRLEEQAAGVHGGFVGWPHHRWLIDVGQASLQFVIKPHHIHARPELHFPAGFVDRLTPEERVQTLWWEGEFSHGERAFMEPDEFDGYLADFVARELRARSLPAQGAATADGSRRRRRLRRLRSGK
jgi:SAM-dependent methyltransferase